MSVGKNTKVSLTMPLNTANGQLARRIIFDLLNKLSLNSCYRCDLPMTLADFTIEHKESWRNKTNAKELFFDLDNIGFSHFDCNSKAAQRGAWNRGKITHGVSGYRLGCRCDICKTLYSQARREKYMRNKT